MTRAADEDAQAALQHVVMTYSPVEGRRIYVNGVYTGDVDAQGGGSRSPTGTTPSRWCSATRPRPTASGKA